MSGDPRLITALDFSTAKEAVELAARLDPALTHLKIGKELFARAGPLLVTDLQSRGFRIFLDLKFHDIPNTVAGALRAAVDLGVWMVDVHASGGRRMLESAREAVPITGDTKLIAITVLTSMTTEDLIDTGVTGSVEDHVRRLAQLTQACKLDGVVCSPQESRVLKQRLGSDFLLITPGVRPIDSAPTDQRRVMTPDDAVDAGSDYLVIGRPITKASDPLASLQAIVSGLGDKAFRDTGFRE